MRTGGVEASDASAASEGMTRLRKISSTSLAASSGRRSSHHVRTDWKESTRKRAVAKHSARCGVDTEEIEFWFDVPGRETNSK